MLWEGEAQQPAVEAPSQAVAVVSFALAGIEAPAKATALQRCGDGHRIVGADALQGLQRWIAQQGFESTGGEPIGTETQQGHEGLLQPWATLLAAVGQAPGQIHPGGILIGEHRGQQRCIALHIGCHHQNVTGLKGGVVSHPAEDAVTHQLHFPPGPRTAHELERLIPLRQEQLAWLRLSCGQLALQLLQQGWSSGITVVHGGGIGKEIALLPAAEHAVTAALQQQLEFSSHAAQDSLQAWGFDQPRTIR